MQGGPLPAGGGWTPPPPAVGDALRSFEPLPHRLEPVAAYRGLIFVNDSISTTPAAAMAALSALADAPIALIAGGYERGQEYAELAAAIVDSTVELVVGLPDTGRRGSPPPRRGTRGAGGSWPPGTRAGGWGRRSTRSGTARRRRRWPRTSTRPLLSRRLACPPAVPCSSPPPRQATCSSGTSRSAAGRSRARRSGRRRELGSRRVRTGRPGDASGRGARAGERRGAAARRRGVRGRAPVRRAAIRARRAHAAHGALGRDADARDRPRGRARGRAHGVRAGGWARPAAATGDHARRPPRGAARADAQPRRHAPAVRGAPPADAAAARGQVAVVRRQHARRAPGARARVRRRSACDAERPGARGHAVVVLLGRGRSGVHAAARGGHDPRLDHQAAGDRGERGDRAEGGAGRAAR